MATTFSSVPEFMAAVSAAQDGAGTAMTTAYGTVTPQVLAGICEAFGPLGVANVIPSLFEATGNNVTSGLLAALNHMMHGMSVAEAQATYMGLDAAQ